MFNTCVQVIPQLQLRRRKAAHELKEELNSVPQISPVMTAEKSPKADNPDI
jgi:hypothetical protein